MPRYCFVVFSNPKWGQEAEYNAWYDGEHLDDVLDVPGFLSARRFRIANPRSTAPHRYLALYEIETDDLQSTLAQLRSRAGTSVMPLSESLDLQGVEARVYEEVIQRARVPRV